ncbi:hypothetical protein ACQ4PT_049827 [Festuca glaucescens]
MAPCSHRQTPPLLPLLLLCFLRAAAATSSSYSFPVFDGKATTDGVVVTTDTAMLAPATFLFDAKLFPEFNQSRGFVLLSRPVALWRDAAGGDGDGASTRDRGEASFNTRFTLDVGGPGSSVFVAFVVLLDSFPPLNRNKHGPRPTEAGFSDTSAVPNATNGVAAVGVGTVSSYGPRSPGIGLNVTITPNRSSGAGQLAVRIEYDAAAHHLSVYVDDGDVGDPRLSSKPALLEAPLELADRLPTQDALVGFFAATVRDVVVGVRTWDLTVDRITDDEGVGQRHPSHNDDSASSSTTWLVILLAVVGSVAAVAVVVVVSVMAYLAVSRRRALDKELQQCYAAHFGRPRLT